MRPDRHRPTADRTLPLVVAGLLLGAVLFPTGDTAGDDGVGVAEGVAQADRAVVWVDVDGNALPFQADEEIVAFMRDADIESFAEIPLGVTGPRQVILERDGVRMRAVLRDYEETYEQIRIDGVFYARLRDSFVFDIAAYELARLLGLNHVPPVTLRRIGADRLSLQIWHEGAIMERDRLEDDMDPPSFRRFREQQQNMRVFDSLIGNYDRNQGNILIDEQWRFWLIDHSRSFPRTDDTRYLEQVTMCARNLYNGIRALDRAVLAERLTPPLTDTEIDWLLRRRDKVVAHIEALIEERTEGAVLFDEPDDGR